jgi:hypothetical protein
VCENKRIVDDVVCSLQEAIGNKRLQKKPVNIDMEKDTSIYRNVCKKKRKKKKLSSLQKKHMWQQQAMKWP